MSNVRIATILLCVSLVSAWIGGVRRAHAVGMVADAEDDLLLLAVRLGSEVLSEATPAYERSGRTLLPLGALCGMLHFAIEVDAPRGKASGHVIRSRRRFELDVAAGRARAEDRTERFERTAVEVRYDDIYVDLELLSRWFPVDLHLDRHAALVNVVAREPLPRQLRLQRQRDIEKALVRLRSGQERLDVQPVPHRFWAMPFVDQTFTYEAVPDGKGRYDTMKRHAAFVTTDLLWMESALRIVGDEVEPFGDVRWTAGRRDPGARLLGPLRAREFAAGEIAAPGMDLVTQSAAGPGFVLSSFPLTRPSEFDRHTFRGDLPTGWEVELYRDGVLLAYQPWHPDGRYEFADVPVLFGTNVFRLVFYGPQGEVREQVQRFHVGAAMAEPGAVYYRVAASEPRDVGRRAQVELDWGASRYLTATLGAAGIERIDGRREYGKLGLRAAHGPLYADAQGAATSDGSWVLDASMHVQTRGIGVRLRHAYLENFESEMFRPVWGPIRSRTGLRLDAMLAPKRLPRLPLELDLRREELQSGDAVHMASSRLSLAWAGFHVGNTNQWNLVRGNQTTLGTLLASKHLSRLTLRHELGYTLHPERRITTVGGMADLRLGWDTHCGIGLQHVYALETTRWLLGLRRTEGPFGIGLRAELGRSQDARFTLTLSTGIGRDPRSGRWHSQARSIASTGAISARVFLDHNDNQRFDAGDEPLPNVRFMLNGAGSPARTGRDGVAFLKNVPSYEGSDVSVTLASLEDPLWVPVRSGLRVVSRPGSVAQLDFPVRLTGEVTGTVRQRRDDRVADLPGVRLELVSPDDGRVVQEVTTAYDGFYDLTQIPPGHWVLRVAAEHRQRFAATTPETHEFFIDAAGDILDGLDFELAAPGRN